MAEFPTGVAAEEREMRPLPANLCLVVLLSCGSVVVFVIESGDSCDGGSGGVTAMLSDRLRNELQQLSHADKLSVVQILVNELAKEAAQGEGQAESLLTPGMTYEVWSPYDSFEAAHQLQEMLDERNGGTLAMPAER